VIKQSTNKNLEEQIKRHKTMDKHATERVGQDEDMLESNNGHVK
jgi:hypothetical protein